MRECPNVIPHRGILDPERRHPRILLDPENPLCFLHMEKHSTLLSKTAHITVTPSRLPDLQAALAVNAGPARSCCSRLNEKPVHRADENLDFPNVPLLSLPKMFSLRDRRITLLPL
jgi:hypothetical protein